MSPNLDSFLQVRLPYPELPSDAPTAYPWLSQFYIVHEVITNCRSNYPELTPTTLMGALLPISQLHHVLERYSFLPQFLFRSSIARINILPYIGARGTRKGVAMRSRHSNTLQETARFTAHCMGGDYIVAARPHYSCPLTSQLMYTHTAPGSRNHPIHAVPVF